MATSQTFVVRLLNLEGIEIDRKYFSQKATAELYAQVEGPASIDNDDVGAAEILDSNGNLIWRKGHIKEADQFAASYEATRKAGLPWHDRPSAREKMPEKLWCRKCQKHVAFHRNERQTALDDRFRCSECDGIINYA